MRASRRSRTCPRTSTSRSWPCRSSPARSSPARSTSGHGRPRAFSPAEVDLLLAIAAQVAQTIEHAKLYRGGAAPRGRARGAGPHLRGGLGVALPRGIPGGDRQDDAWRQWTLPAPRSCSRTARSRGPRDVPVRTPCGFRSAGSGRQIGELVCDRDTPFTDEERALLGSIAHHAAVALEHGRAVMRACSPRRSTTASRTTCRRSRRSSGCRRASADAVNPRKALDDSVNRILAIAAVHEVLTEHRDDDVELAELRGPAAGDARPGARGGEAGRDRARAGLARGEPRDRARARLQRAVPERARARRRDRADRARSGGTATSCSRSPTTAAGWTAGATGPGSRSCARWCGTSCRDRCGSRTRAGCAPKWCFRRRSRRMSRPAAYTPAYSVPGTCLAPNGRIRDGCAGSARCPKGS